MSAAALKPVAVENAAIISIRLEDLIESHWNPRKHFDPARLAEMVESLRTKGQLAPIIVRPRPGGNFEIGAGHRRFRAAPKAGFTHLLAIVREMEDVAFLELLTIENKQREDVTPLDEAAGFKLLMEKAGYDVSKLAARIGLSMKYVYDRLKLLQLIPDAKKYLEDGTITAGHAILLARLKPADQKRVVGDPKRVNRYQFQAGGGLFQGEDVDYDPEQPSLELPRAVKAVSVRELGNYINDHVRFRPEEADPVLFPETVAVLKQVTEDDLQPVYITHDHALRDDAKDGKVRTYGYMSWRRADGKEKSKTCAWSRVGIVAAGQHRGDAYRVCVNRDKCEVHFPDSARARKKKKSGAASPRPSFGGGYSVQDNLERKRREEAEKAEQARWKKALPVLRRRVADKIKAASTAPSGLVATMVLRRCSPGWARGSDGIAKKLLPAPRTADDVLRLGALTVVMNDLNEYRASSMTDVFRKFGLDAQKIVDEVAPKPKPEPKAPPKKKGGRK